VLKVLWFAAAAAAFIPALYSNTSQWNYHKELSREK
jgi:hypothetical protein